VRAQLHGEDVATRQRLLDVASALFSEHGYHHVTVRDICRQARANLAAVNYHFGDKLGLYLEVVKAAIATVRPIEDQLRVSAADQPPAEQLTRYIRQAVSFTPANEWVQRLFGRELHQPVPEASALIVSRVLRPRLRYLSGLVAEMLSCPPDDTRVRNCTASILGQLLLLRSRPLRALVYGDGESSEGADALASHIVEFSLAGIRALGARAARRRS
jgi:AcrR family transcriptional regulator